MPPAESSRVTVAELGRRLDHMEADTKAGFAGVHRRLDELNVVHPETFAMQLQLDHALRQNMEDRLTELRNEFERQKSNTQWLWRTVGGSVITAAVVALAALSGWSPT